MLILGRHVNEGVTITAPNGDTLHIVLTAVERGRSVAKLGFDAPKDYVIVRDELLQGKINDRHDAAASAGAGSSEVAQAIVEAANDAARQALAMAARLCPEAYYFRDLD